jgi:hypothetical protein
MAWMLFWLLSMGVIIVVLWRYSKPVDQIEDDTSYLFEGGRPGTPYGSKFLNILLGRDDD